MSSMSASAPQPHKTISCQQLLQDDVSHCGWIRRRSKFHRSIKFVVKVIPWMNKYSALSKGCLYIFDSDTAKKPSGAFSLYGYNSVKRAGDVHQKEAPWAFKLLTYDGDPARTRYFSASSEREQKAWMTALKKQMMFANGKGTRVSNRSHSINEEDASYNDIEDDVYDTTSNVSIGHTDDLEESDDDVDDYNHIEDWDDADENPDPNSDLQFRPLPPVPPGGPPIASAPSTIDRPPPRPARAQQNRKNENNHSSFPSEPRSPVENSSRVKVFPSESLKTQPPIDHRPPPPMKKPVPPTPTQPPPDDDADIELSPTKAKKPLPSLPNKNTTRSNVPPVAPKPKGVFIPPANNQTEAMASTVTALAAMFNEKKSQSQGDKKTTPLPPPTERPPAPIADHRSRTDGNENKNEEDILRDILWNGADKEEASRMLSDRAEEGVFLIRNSDRGEQVLVVYAEGGPRKYKIHRVEGMVYITSEKQFNNIKDMLDFYHREYLPKRTTCLKKPYTR